MQPSDLDPNNPERSAGSLTAGDRKYLLGEVTPASTEAENVKRHRIRQRIRQSIVDLSLAHNRMQRRDVSLVFDLDAESSQRLEECIIDAIAFLYLGTDNFEDSIEDALQRAIEQYAGFGIEHLSVDLTVWPDEGESGVEKAIQMIENSEDVPTKAINSMYVAFRSRPTDEQMERLKSVDHPAARGLVHFIEDMEGVWKSDLTPINVRLGDIVEYTN